ncbi:MAG: NADH-quinone oxidoreductase subunit D [Bacillota bacterium]
MALTQEREITVNMGPQHPSTHGVLRMVVKLDGETVVQAKPDIGYLHRCFEKLSEQKTYTQVITFTDRTDYLSAMTNEWAFVLGIEKLLGIEVPERAEYMRVIVAELQRIASHLIWFGTFSLDLGAATPFIYAFRERERIYDLFESISGGRLLYNYFRIGGLRNDFPPGWKEKVLEFLDFLDKKALPEYHKLFTGNRIVEVRTQGVGVLKPETAIAYGASGPVLRGSGVDWDLRRDMPYGYYHKFDWQVVTEQGGDVFSRYMVRMREIEQSSRIVRQALQALPDGDYLGKVPKVLKPPKDAEIYVRHEGSRGEVGVYLISDGTPSPYRCHWRSPAFVHLQLVEPMAIGWKIADLVAILGSIDIVLGEVDR